MVFFEGDFITVSIHLPVGNLVLRCRNTLHIQYTIFEPPLPPPLYYIHFKNIYQRNDVRKS